MNLMLGPLAQGTLLLSIIYWYSKTMLGMINEYYRDELKKTISDVPETYPNEITEIVEEKDDDVTLKTPYVSSPSTEGIPDILKEAVANNGDNGILTRACSDNNIKEKTQESSQLNHDDNLLKERFSILLREREEQHQKQNQHQQNEEEEQQENQYEEKQNIQNGNKNSNGKKLQTNFPSIIDNDKHQLCEKYSRIEQKLLDFNLENLCFPSGKQLDNFEVQDNVVVAMKENEYIKEIKSSILSDSSFSTKSENPLTLKNKKQPNNIENSILKSSTANKFDYITVTNQYNKEVKPTFQQSSSYNKLLFETTKNIKNEEAFEKLENFPLTQSFQNLENKNLPIKSDESNEPKQNYLKNEFNEKMLKDNCITNSKIKYKNLKSRNPYHTTSDNKNIFQFFNSVVDDGKINGNYNFVGENSFKNKNHPIKMMNSLSSCSSISTISTDSDDNNDGNNINQPSYNKILTSKSKIRSFSKSVSDNIDAISKSHSKPLSMTSSSSLSSTSSLESRSSYKKKYNNEILTNRDLNCRRKSVSQYIEFWSNLK